MLPEEKVLPLVGQECDMSPPGQDFYSIILTIITYEVRIFSTCGPVWTVIKMLHQNLKYAIIKPFIAPGDPIFFISVMQYIITFSSED